MDSSSIDLPGSQVESIEQQGDEVRVVFSRALLVKSMTGSKELTRWWQPGVLVFEQAELLDRCPQGPLVCDGGDVGENIYTYRDMIPVPLKSQGRAHCDLRFRDCELGLRVQATGVRLEMSDRPHYIEHVRPA